ncbi:MAG: hypothetical protein EZS28_005295 [Streblomastix strix]|uniref:Tyr recombinase domain-containing protein n=1 Tax=Streblomastix strix TaxID=222440 RepID=A0A5J4WVZ7_9EUKA|nr:MAG: hypothetical protein EZS28_005295 [Streblomastix strix]
MGRVEKEIRNKVMEQLMLKSVANTRKVIREVTIWKMEQLLDYIVKLSVDRDNGSLTVTELRRVVITIFMVYSVLRLSELQRAMLNTTQIDQGIITICTNLHKGKRGRVEVTLKVVNNKAVCPITWFKAWNEKRKIKTTDKDLLWKNSENKRSLTPEKQVGSPYVRWVTQSAMKWNVMEHHLQQGELTSPTLRNCVALPWKRSEYTEASEEMEGK